MLIHGVDVSAARRALVVSLLSFGAHINARIIAEGIETEEELQTLLSLGVEFGQGWHLGRPVMVAPPADAASVVAVAPDLFSKQRSIPFQAESGGQDDAHLGGNTHHVGFGQGAAARQRAQAPHLLIESTFTLLGRVKGLTRGRYIVDHHDEVDRVGHRRDHPGDVVLFAVGRHDGGDALPLVHRRVTVSSPRSRRRRGPATPA